MGRPRRVSSAERMEHVLPNRFEDYLQQVLGGDSEATSVC